MQKKNAPKGVQISGSFTRPLGSQEMLFKKQLLYKKNPYIKLKNPTADIYSIGPQVNTEGTFHLNEVVRRPALMSGSTLS